ncbi:hypothetical protein CPC08DRAFT_747691 [Agrocybe pediades]|nr:hypothetical protein CPC08DRAFT_747691 [Agrocybe pediades]
MSAQPTSTHGTNAITTPFAFLSAPPPPKPKRRALLASPPPCPSQSPPPPTPSLPSRISTFTRITTWAAHVQPGSPAPWSPPSHSPSSNTLPSVSHGRARSGSLAHLVDTQLSLKTPSTEANYDLTALGYTSVFVHIPEMKVPLSASLVLANVNKPPIPHRESVEDIKQKGMKRFRSLSILRPKLRISQLGTALPMKAHAAAVSPSAMTRGSAGLSPTSYTSRESRAEICAATIAQRKRAKYAYVRPPPTFANELAIMQFTGGGNLETHAKRVMEAQAKAVGGTRSAAGVADVYRDEKGGIWWDADEELEYVHLLDGSGPAVHTEDNFIDLDGDVEMDWEEPFSPDAHEQGADKENIQPAMAHELPARRLSVSTVDSDLDPKHLVPLPENEDPKLTPIDDHVLISGAPGMSILSLPARPRRHAMHLRKPMFLVDVKIWEGSTGQSSPTKSTVSASTKHHTGGVTKLKGKARRRPAPLKLVPASASGVSRIILQPPSTSEATTFLPPVPAPHATEQGIEQIRDEFIADSFVPQPPVAHLQGHTRPRMDMTDSESFSMISTSMASFAPTSNSKQAKSKLARNVRGLFRRGE